MALPIQDVYHVMQAISATEAAPMVRVPSSDPALIMKVLDLGAYRGHLSLGDTAEEAAGFVNASSYPPVGTLIWACAWHAICGP